MRITYIIQVFAAMFMGACLVLGGLSLQNGDYGIAVFNAALFAVNLIIFIMQFVIRARQ